MHRPNLNKIAGDASDKICALLGDTLNQSECERITSIIAKSMELAVQQTCQEQKDVCVTVLSHDQDLAHKIHEQMELKKIALIANLSSLR